MWKNGLDFLHESCIQRYIDINRVDTTISEQDEEVQTMKVFAAQNSANIASRFDRYSNVDRFLKSIAILKGCIKQKNVGTTKCLRH